MDSNIEAICEKDWHYVGRLKSLESFAQKLETGRFSVDQSLQDMFACTVVVERADRIKEAENRLRQRFEIHERKPERPEITHHRAMCFDFDYVRLYASLKKDERVPPTGYESLVFEIQIKTFLQHAWTIATHDLVYKSDSIDWEASRIAYQIKAMLEHAETSITSVKAISQANQPQRSDQETLDQQEIVKWLQREWPSGLPKDVIRLADCVRNLLRVLNLNIAELGTMLTEATNAGTEPASTSMTHMLISPHFRFFLSMARPLIRVACVRRAQEPHKRSGAGRL